jgi:hypothetical protein
LGRKFLGHGLSCGKRRAVNDSRRRGGEALREAASASRTNKSDAHEFWASLLGFIQSVGKA